MGCRSQACVSERLGNALHPLGLQRQLSIKPGKAAYNMQLDMWVGAARAVQLEHEVGRCGHDPERGFGVYYMGAHMSGWHGGKSMCSCSYPRARTVTQTMYPLHKHLPLGYSHIFYFFSALFNSFTDSHLCPLVADTCSMPMGQC